ncbi:hypothetical protein F5890DRAFT_1171259 [Lentinula detonsa]|uniref:Uncharacterized protein n=1 Tax=Lentinula detonsa TaxID=2804962 RepID=A0AA38USN9_9AGAR|nr:hypothetical protein F5890DRAFT_1171259 [Lentinula detonsa]
MRATLSLSLLCLLWAFFPSINHLGVIAIPTPPVPALHGLELLPCPRRFEFSDFTITSSHQVRSKAGLVNVPIVLSRGAWRNDENINIRSDEKWTLFVGSYAFRLKNHQTSRVSQTPPREGTLIGHVTFTDADHRREVWKAMTQIQGAQTNLIYIVLALAKLEQLAVHLKFHDNSKYYDVMLKMFRAKGTADGGVISGDETTKAYENIEFLLEKARLEKLTTKELQDVADKLLVID